MLIALPEVAVSTQVQASPVGLEGEVLRWVVEAERLATVTRVGVQSLRLVARRWMRGRLRRRMRRSAKVAS